MNRKPMSKCLSQLKNRTKNKTNVKLVIGEEILYKSIMYADKAEMGRQKRKEDFESWRRSRHFSS